MTSYIAEFCKKSESFIPVTLQFNQCYLGILLKGHNILSVEKSPVVKILCTAFNVPVQMLLLCIRVPDSSLGSILHSGFPAVCLWKVASNSSSD